MRPITSPPQQIYGTDVHRMAFWIVERGVPGLSLDHVVSVLIETGEFTPAQIAQSVDAAIAKAEEILQPPLDRLKRAL